MNDLNWEVKSGNLVLSYNYSNHSYTMKHLVTKEEKTASYDSVHNFINAVCGNLPRPQTPQQILEFLITQG